MQQVFTCSVTLNPTYTRVSTVYRSISVSPSMHSPVVTQTRCLLGQISLFTNTDAYPEHARFLQCSAHMVFCYTLNMLA